MYTFNYSRDNCSAVIIENGFEVTTIVANERMAAGFVRWLNCVSPQNPGAEQIGLWFMRFVESNPSLEG